MRGGRCWDMSPAHIWPPFSGYLIGNKQMALTLIPTLLRALFPYF